MTVAGPIPVVVMGEEEMVGVANKSLNTDIKITFMDNSAKLLSVDEDVKISRWGKLRYWWYRKTRYTWWDRFVDNGIRSFIRGIRNIIKWGGIVWKDRDWGYDYIYDVLAFKIKNTRDYILKHDIIADFHLEKINRYCTLSLKLIEKISEEEYGLEYLDYFQSDHNFLPIGDTFFIDKGKEEKIYQYNVVELSNSVDVYFKKYPHTYKLVQQKILKKEPDRINEKKYVAMQMAVLNHERAKKLLFDILAEQCEDWWD